MVKSATESRRLVGECSIRLDLRHTTPWSQAVVIPVRRVSAGAVQKPYAGELVDMQGCVRVMRRSFPHVYQEIHSFLLVPDSSPCRLSQNSHGLVAILPVHIVRLEMRVSDKSHDTQ